MAAGIQLTQADINNAYGSVARDLEVLMTRINELNTWWQSFGGGIVTTYGFVQADADTLGSTNADLFKLYQVYHALATQAAAYDFTQNAKKCWGLGF